VYDLQYGQTTNTSIITITWRS